MSSRRLQSIAASVLAGGAASVCLSFSSPSHAGGFYIQEQSTRGAGRAYSGEGADMGPESIWWNPAAIASSPTEAFASVSGIFPSSGIDDRGSTLTFPGAPPVTVPVGGDPHATDPILPGVTAGTGFGMPLNDRFAIGLAITTPFDFVTDYKEDSFARFGAIKSRLDTVDVQPTVAVKATPWLDLGLSADAVYSSARLTNASPNLVPGVPDGFSNLHGDGWNWGWTFGAQLHGSDDKWRAGVSYRASVGHELSGEASLTGLVGPLAGANFVTHADATFSTPWILTFSMRAKVTDKLTLDGQLQRLGWSEFRSIDVNLPFGVDVIPQNYQDVTSAALGVDYAPNPIVTVRAGLQWDPTPTPEVGRTLRVPDSNRWLFSAGGEMKLPANLTVEGAIEYVDFLGSHIDNTDVFYPGTPAQTLAQNSADITANAVVISGGVRWRF
jgi:long-chain fatty acid transport protein